MHIVHHTWCAVLVQVLSPEYASRAAAAAAAQEAGSAGQPAEQQQEPQTPEARQSDVSAFMQQDSGLWEIHSHAMPGLETGLPTAEAAAWHQHACYHVMAQTAVTIAAVWRVTQGVCSGPHASMRSWPHPSKLAAFQTPGPADQHMPFLAAHRQQQIAQLAMQLQNQQHRATRALLAAVRQESHSLGLLDRRLQRQPKQQPWQHRRQPQNAMQMLRGLQQQQQYQRWCLHLQLTWSGALTVRSAMQQPWL